VRASGRAAAPPREAVLPSIGNRAFASLVLAREPAAPSAAPIETRDEKIVKFKAALADARAGAGTWDRVGVVLNGFDRADIARLTAALSKDELQTLRTAVETELRAWGRAVDHVLAGIDKSAAAKGGGIRPESSSIWSAYDSVKYKPNGPGSWAGLAQEEVWDFIGGHVGNAFGPHENTCAARLSWALNSGGMPVTEYEAGWTYPNPVDRVDTKGPSHRHGDGKKYIVSAPYMETYLTKKWGKPDAHLKTNDDAKKLALGLKGQQVAVFAGHHHVGVMRQYTTDGYKDAYVFTDPGVMPVSAWLLK
jgi:hypothetical protein